MPGTRSTSQSLLADIHDRIAEEIEEEDELTHEPEEEVAGPPVARGNAAKMKVHYPPSLIQLSTYKGDTQPSHWTKQFQRWYTLQNLTPEQAANTLPFYLKDAAKIYYEGLPNATKQNVKQVLRLLEVRFESDEDDLFVQQQANESAQDFIDRIIIRASEQNIPINLVLKIAKKGFHPSLRHIIIQRDPKSLEELKHAASIAKKCLESKITAAYETKIPAVNALSQSEVKTLQNSILSKKVESLGRENFELKQKFGQENARNQNYQGQNQNRRSFNFEQRNFQAASPSCSTCGMNKCSGKREECFARNKTCHRCKRQGHFINKCKAVRDVNGEIIRQ